MTKFQLSPLRRKDMEAGRRLERQEIVAWLRRSEHNDHLHSAAALIEAEEFKQ